MTVDLSVSDQIGVAQDVATSFLPKIKAIIDTFLPLQTWLFGKIRLTVSFFANWLDKLNRQIATQF